MYLEETLHTRPTDKRGFALFLSGPRSRTNWRDRKCKQFPVWNISHSRALVRIPQHKRVVAGGEGVELRRPTFRSIKQSIHILVYALPVELYIYTTLGYLFRSDAISASFPVGHTAHTAWNPCGQSQSYATVNKRRLLFTMFLTLRVSYICICILYYHYNYILLYIYSYIHI